MIQPTDRDDIEKRSWVLVTKDSVHGYEYNPIGTDGRHQHSGEDIGQGKIQKRDAT